MNAPTYDGTHAHVLLLFLLSGVPERGLKVVVRPNCAFFAFSTNMALCAVFVAAPTSEFSQMSSRPASFFEESLSLAPSLAGDVACERAAGGTFQRCRRSAELLPQALWGGWALVACMPGTTTDPFLALGVNDAFGSRREPKR